MLSLPRLASFLFLSSITLAVSARDFVITSYRAKAGGTVINTRAIASAIEAAAKDGGGRVVVPKGVWLTGPVHLLSGVELHLAEGAVLEFTDNPTDYLPAVHTSWEGIECYNYSPLVYAYRQHDIAITGTGTLRPRMATWRGWFARPKAHLAALSSLYTMMSTGVAVEQRQMAVGENHLRPHLIQFNRCKNVRLENFHIRQSPFWTIHMYLCDGGTVRGLDVQAHGHNNDGIDIEGSRNFLIEDCIFDQGDDAVVIKSGRNQDAWRLNTPAENIEIRNCRIIKGHTLLGIGTELSGGVRNVFMHDCTAPSVHILLFVKTNRRRGAFVENIRMENVRAHDARQMLGIQTDVLYQWRSLVPTYEERLTRIDGIHMRGVECDSVGCVYEIVGDPKLPVRNVTLDSIHARLATHYTGRADYVDGLTLRGVMVDSLPKRIQTNI